jgi:hypothetical protein
MLGNDIVSAASGSSTSVKRMTLTVAQYAKLAGVGESVVRQEIAANRLPHRKFGKRGLIRILRGPALAQLGNDPQNSLEDSSERSRDAVG